MCVRAQQRGRQVVHKATSSEELIKQSTVQHQEHRDKSVNNPRGLVPVEKVDVDYFHSAKVERAGWKFGTRWAHMASKCIVSLSILLY